MMAIEPFLSSSPVDEHHEDNHRYRPVAYRPVDQSHKVPKEPPSEFPDNVHVITLREKQFACELGVIIMLAVGRDEVQ